MSEETKVGTEATTENKAPETDAPKKEKTVAEEAKVIPEKEEKEETSESLAEASDEAKSSEAKTTDDEEDITEIIKRKSGSQKRIDKLTAQNKELVERLDKLEASRPEEGKKTYTDAQLRAALKKGLEEQDHDLIADIIDYRVNSVKDSIRKEYKDEQKAIANKQKAVTKEWKDTVDTYTYLSDPKKAEIYPGSHDELNIGNNSSYLIKEAMKLYNSVDVDLFELYHQPGGQARAVTDALATIIQRRGGIKPTNKEADRLEKKLAKEKRKNSLAAPETEKSEEETPTKPLTDKERVDSVINERKTTLRKRRGEDYES